VLKTKRKGIGKKRNWEILRKEVWRTLKRKRQEKGLFEGTACRPALYLSVTAVGNDVRMFMQKGCIKKKNPRFIGVGG